MGPLRRRLTAGFLLAPQAGFSEVCDKIRPGWAATDGPQSAAAETAHILGSSVGVMVLLLLALALVFPRRWLALIAAIPALALCALLALGRLGATSALAMTEGCVGTVTPTLLILILATIVTLARAYLRPGGLAL